MKYYQNPEKDTWDSICERPTFSFDQIAELVKPILSDVQKNGDEAIRKYTAQWDGVTLNRLIVTKNEINAAIEILDEDLKRAIQVAYQNIKKFHQLQIEDERITETMPGVVCWQKSVAIEKVGLYVPGGSAPLFSSVLMLAIPAQIAGCRMIQLATPPRKDGTVHPAILYAASLAGIHKIIKAGGAQAIAGLIYGTNSIEPVHKIFGPGNQYVTAAKQLGQQEGVAMDLPAGPSEVLVMMDETADAQFVAADLIAQAEHGADSQVVLVANQAVHVQSILDAVQAQLQNLPRKSIAEKAIENSMVVQFDDDQQIIPFVNHYAPEHLIISMSNPGEWADQIVHAGSVFLGHFTPESVGDYASGTNHTLPTNGFARNYSGVNLDAFVKKITYQKLTPEGLRHIGDSVMTLARAEELEGHARAVEFRLKTLNAGK